MSLFACIECNVIENTATAGMVFDDKNNRILLCSQCNPDLKHWHDLFPREYFNEGEWERIPGSKYVRRKVVSSA